ncbi:MAG: methionine gamma-lyase family protein [Candidatus Eremiobacteraeota bacterium]|nr:methionine gamma-lyase family protein [Candidatus Eremiobacteraeota bacterium]
MIEELCAHFAIARRVRSAALVARERTAGLAYPAQTTVAANVLHAFIVQGAVESDLHGTVGYGYDDAARACYESLLARIFGVERALARLSIVSGTHAIVAALTACTPPGATLVSITGRPYDTLRNAICDAPHSLVSRGIDYREIALRPDGEIDIAAVTALLERETVHAIFVQRSRGYAPRPALSIERCERAFAAIRAVAPDSIILVDNCYGELVETREPTHAGADVVMGSLIKNLGGSIAPAGGYVAGRDELVERIAAWLYAPGLGSALGPSLGSARALLQGLFLAPLVVEQCLRSLDFTAALFEELGYDVDPKPGQPRSDIVQAIALRTPQALARFAEGLQSAMPVNACFRPEPGNVPGYAEPVIMSSGAFVAGATIELSCDAPLRAPYQVYVQGGTSAMHGYLGALFAANALEVEK